MLKNEVHSQSELITHIEDMTFYYESLILRMSRYIPHSIVANHLIDY